MKFNTLLAAGTVGSLMLLASGVAANPAEVKVMAGGALAGVIRELGPQFERTTGHKLVMQYGLSRTFRRQIEAGEAFDLVILSVETMDELTKQGKIAAGPPAEVARAGVGVAVRAGAAKPDISSVDAFKRVMLNAKSITYTPGSETGGHLAIVFQRLGIADEMKAKTKPQRGPEAIAQAIANGEAELALAVTSSLLLVGGVELVGKLPPELQNYLVFTAAVGVAAREPEGAKALIKHLTSPEAIPVFKARGWDPVTR